MSEWWLLGLLGLFTILACGLLVYPLKMRVGLVLAPCIFVLATVGYFLWGGFEPWREYVHQVNSKKLAERLMKNYKSPQDLINQLRAKLDDTAASAKGWYLLGRLYSSQKDVENAVQAFAKAYQFNPADETYAVNYAHSLWEQNNKKYTSEVRRILAKVLENNADQVDALTMLAMDADEQHDKQQALSYWRRLLKLVPENSKEAEFIRKAMM